ncbi:MAG: ribose 5-phosphate isomerase B [Planctomycetes bacterium RBG_13_60_9]|nr:MAG: ribose 5-phosphate isomerase B [Planctomycetes bacterium RBG_13_60_9]
MKIALGTDHAGYELKEEIKRHLIGEGHEVNDFGTYSNESCDYPDFIYPAALAVAQGECDRAIVIGGSGNGENIVANKVRGIRCAVCWNEELARLSRAHNDANVISIGARTVSPELAMKMLDVWLKTPFDGGRHALRIQKIAALDKCSREALPAREISHSAETHVGAM